MRPHQNCCVANGPRGLMLVPQLAVMRGAAGPVVNYYGAMRSLVPLPAGGNVDLEQDSDYPLGGSIRIRIGLDTPRTFALRLRIPAWSERNALSINGASQAAPATGAYASLDRTWHDGDLVVLQLDMRPRVVRAPGHPEYAAIERGPLVLARDARLERGSDVNAPVALKTTGDGRVEGMLAESPASTGIWQIFDVPMGKDAAPLRLCDFASSGNTWDSRSTYRVWMPLAQLKARVAQSP